MLRRRSGSPTRVDVQMTPMIDVVFQLLTFFLMTFRIAAAEGDVSLRLPRNPGPLGPSISTTEHLRVRLIADANGDLAQLRIGGNEPVVGAHAWAALHSVVVRAVGAARDAGVPEPDVELDADDGLHYAHVVAAVSAVSLQKTADGNVVPLVKKVAFARR